jgi:3-hydroxybutyrate dehydrogenase
MLERHRCDAFDAHRPKTVRRPVALVTGSTSGIGLGIARSLAKTGMDIMLNGFGAAVEIGRIRAGLEDAYSVRTEYSDADLGKEDQVGSMLDACAERLGPVDVLVNNAGILHVGAVDETPAARWQAMLAVNLSGAFYAIRAVLPGMKARGSGRIINVASALGLTGAGGYAAYAASKHGVVGLTRAVALEVATLGITVNAICPGFVLTPLVERELNATAQASGMTLDEAKSAALAHTQPIGRFVTPEEIGALAAYLVGEDARSITGAAIAIDGGWTAQ